MKEYIEHTLTNADGAPKAEKIKTPLAQITVEQYHGKEYYGILWLDTKDWSFYIGYGSYNLEFVRKWLAEEFEIVESAADVVERKRGEWVDKPNPQWKAYDIRHCSVCGWSIHKSKLRNADLNWHFCPNCGSDMREVDHAAD